MGVMGDTEFGNPATWKDIALKTAVAFELFAHHGMDVPKEESDWRRTL